MRRMTFCATLAAALLSTGSVAADDRPSPVPLTSADAEAWLDGFLPYALKRGDVAGAVVVIVSNGAVLVQKGYGHADVDRRLPVDPERTLFRIGSVAKLFTWTAVMQLVESGRLELDRDINDYLDFPIPSRDGRPVTLRNLMTHTPGFEEVVKNLVTDDVAQLRPLDEYLRAWTPERIHPPGEVPAYSNYGASVAGYIVQRVSGETFDDYMDRRLFGPLGMTNTTTRQPLPAALSPYMSSGYARASDAPSPFEYVNSAPAGAATASGADMARFMLAFLQGGQPGAARILKPETVQKIFDTRFPVVPPLNGMLLGFYQQDLNGRRIAGHAGDTQFFHSTLDLFVDDGAGLFLAMNSTGRDYASFAIRTALIDEFADRYFPKAADERPVEAGLAAAHARLLVGVYEPARRAQSSFLDVATLLSQVVVSLDDHGHPLIPAITGINGQPMKWREVAPFVWQQIDGKERLAARVADGRVVMFSIDSLSPFNVFQPAAWSRSSAWLLPSTGVALAAIILTLATWPMAALARRRYRVAFDLCGTDLRIYRLLRLASLGSVAIFAAWGMLVASLSSDLFVFSSRLDVWILLLQIASVVIIGGATVFAFCNTRLAWAGSRGWGSRLWSVVLLASFGLITWISIAFNLIGFGTNY